MRITTPISMIVGHRIKYEPYKSCNHFTRLASILIVLDID